VVDFNETIKCPRQTAGSCARRPALMCRLRAQGRARPTTAGFTARGKAFRFPKGQSGNISGQSRFYHECRKLAREASPEMMAGLIDLLKMPWMSGCGRCA
jgi:hypothetical protein